MTFEERVEFYMSIAGLSREDAERRARLDLPVPDLDPWSPPADGEPFVPRYASS